MQESPHKALLLDTIKHNATEQFVRSGFEVAHFAKDVNDIELADRAQGMDVLGVRSGPRVTDYILGTTTLDGVGIYAVGSDHIDKREANECGVAIFNAPYDNGRSVAEWVIGSTYSLLRQLHTHNLALHNGQWTKTDESSYEVRGKTIGIIGFGNIGRQVATLAEANGMNVVFYDVQDQPVLGNSHRSETIADLLQVSDVVTVHVPGGEKPVIGEAELAVMKPDSVLLNASRSEAVDAHAVLEAVRGNHLGGAAFDVHKDEPRSNAQPFISELADDSRILLTPHIGGSTIEAQYAAADSVTRKLVRYINEGVTNGSLNIPAVSLNRLAEGSRRVTYIHKNETGANGEIIDRFKRLNINIGREVLNTMGGVGYAVYDVETERTAEELRDGLEGLESEVRLRVL